MQTQDADSCAAPATPAGRGPTSALGSAAPPHPSKGELIEFLLGQSTPGTALLVSQHTARCQSCRIELLDMGGFDLRPSEPDLGAWLALAAGLEVAPVQGASGLGEAVYALRVQRGGRLSSDAPLKLCEVLVIDGALVCEERCYRPGDFLRFDPRLPTSISATDEAGLLAFCTTLETDLAAGEA